MTTSITNEFTSLQKYKSLILYFRKGDVLLCVRDEWRQGRTAILIQVLLSTIAALLSHLSWGCSTMGHWGPSPLQSGSHFGIPVSTELDPPGHLLILFSNFPFASTLLRLIYTGVSLDMTSSGEPSSPPSNCYITQKGPGNNVYETVSIPFLQLQNCIVTTRCSPIFQMSDNFVLKPYN